MQGLPRKVVLVATAGIDEHGSMRAYASCVQAGLARHAPGVETEMLELAPRTASGKWGRRFELAAQHWRARRARGRAPDLWHVLDGSRAHVARAFGDAPVVITVHDVIPWLQDQGEFAGVPPLGAAARAVWNANGNAMRRADALLCDSRATARDVQRAFRVANDACHVVPLALRPGIERRVASLDTAPGREALVLHVGNNGFYKNRSGVLRVFAGLDAPTNARLAMAGPRPTPGLLDDARALGIADRVEWIDDPGDDELAGLYRRASVLLFPSRYEGFGWPVLEAMAFGVPVVASDGGSLPEVLGPGQAAFAPDDHAGMARAVSRLLHSVEARNEAAAHSRRRAATFSERAFAEGTLAAYSAALAARAPVPA